MSIKKTLFLSVIFGLTMLTCLINPAVYSIYGSPAQYPTHEYEESYYWKVPVFNGEVYEYSLYVRTPISISDKDYEASIHDQGMIRHQMLDCGFYIPDCPQCVIDCICDTITMTGNDMDELSDYCKCIVIQSFVASGIRYEWDHDIYGCEDYAQTPVETLYLRTGDCEDMSILFVSIARAFGLDSKTISYEDHCTAGVRIEGYEGSTVDGYVSVECTAMTYQHVLPICSEDGGKIAWSQPYDPAIGYWIIYCNLTQNYNPILKIWELLS